MKLGLLLLVAAFSGTLSCVTDPVDPPREDIRFEITASPSSGSTAEPVILHIKTRNAGGTTVLLPRTCPEPPYRFHDDAGNELLTQDPTNREVCPQDAYLEPFAPGTSWEVTYAFEGRYYSPTGEALEARPGTYKATAHFVFLRNGESGNPEIVTLIRDVRFTWQ